MFGGLRICITVHFFGYYDLFLITALILIAVASAIGLISFLRRFARERRTTDEYMRLMFESIPMPCDLWDENARLIYCNAQSLKLFGLSCKEEYQRRFYEFSPEYQPDGKLSRDVTSASIDAVLKGGSLHLEWLHNDINGEPIYVDVTAVRVKYEGKYAVAVYKYNMREHKAMLDEIHKSGEMTNIMFNAMPLCANYWTEDHTIYDCNDEIVRLFELKDKREYIERFYDFSPEFQPDGRRSADAAPELVDRAFKDGYCRFEWVMRKPDGELIPTDVSLVRARHRDKPVVIAYFSDLREQKAMVDEINKVNEINRKQAHWYVSLLDSLPFALISQDMDMKRTFVNKAYETLVGEKRENLIGLPCSTAGAPICNTENCAVVRARQGQMRTFSHFCGATHQIDTKVIKDMNGQDVGYIEVIQDISEKETLLKKQVEAESANKAKSKFLTTISHEIRTPMNAILGAVDIQMQKDPVPPDIREAYEIIYNSGNVLLGIINDLLDSSKIEAGKMEITPVKYDVAGLIYDSVKLNIPRIGSKPVEFDLRVSPAVPSELYGDDLRIKQILNNILSNAIKYTDKGCVSLSVEDGVDGDKAELIFKVCDTGIGMTREQINSLFDEYSRFATVSARTTQGTGLGMSIARSLTHLMGGDILIESEPGKGTSVTIRLPQEKTGSNVIGKETADDLTRFYFSSPQSKRPQILYEPIPGGSALVVDDAQTNLYVIKGLLSPYKLKVDTAGSGTAAVEKIKDGNVYDIIFMDHLMPGMDGVETAGIIRGMGYSNPIVALTANALTGQAEMFMENGFDSYISKPIDTRLLDAVIKKFIHKPSGKEEVAWSGANAGTRMDRILAISFARDAEKVLAALKAAHDGGYRGDGDAQGCVVNYHMIKSALASIGEIKLSDTAKRLETAARDWNTDLLSHETPAFMEALRAVVEKIKPGEGVESDENPEFLREKLRVIGVAALEYDVKAIQYALDELDNKEWSRETLELLDYIRARLLNSDFEEIADAIDQDIIS